MGLCLRSDGSQPKKQVGAVTGLRDLKFRILYIYIYIVISRVLIYVQNIHICIHMYMSSRLHGYCVVRVNLNFF